MLYLPHALGQVCTCLLAMILPMLECLCGKIYILIIPVNMHFCAHLTVIVFTLSPEQSPKGDLPDLVCNHIPLKSSDCLPRPTVL